MQDGEAVRKKQKKNKKEGNEIQTVRHWSCYRKEPGIPLYRWRLETTVMKPRQVKRDDYPGTVLDIDNDQFD